MIDVVLAFLFLTLKSLTYFTRFSSLSIIDSLSKQMLAG